LPKDNHQHILIDEIIELTGVTSKKNIQLIYEGLLFGMRKMNKPLKLLPTKRLGQQTLSVSFITAGGR
jgi:hypothetical protein